MNLKTVFPLAAIVTAAALTAAGCGGSTKTVTSTVTAPAAAATTDTTAASTTPVTSVDMVMTDFKFAPDDLTVVAGKVPVTQKNDGGVKHEFVLLKTEEAADSFTVKGGEINEESAGTNVGEIEDVLPGKSKSKTFDLKPGKYVFICNLPGHYAGGMYGSMIVQ